MLTGPDDLRARARAALPRFLFDYIDGGAHEEVTLRENRNALQRLRIRQRVMRDVSRVRTVARFFGADAALPIGLAPVGLAGMCARRGEVQAARAAETAQIPFCLSTVAICSLSEVAAATSRPFWFQLYMIRDRGFMVDILELAQRHCSVLVLTVDMPVGATRYRDIRSGLTGAPGVLGLAKRGFQAALRPRWSFEVGLRGRPHTIGNLRPVLGRRAGTHDFAAWIAHNFDPSVTWEDLDFVRAHWSGAIVIKGILDPEDAELALQAGADGVVVSNHGGRQLDGALASAEALPAIADRIGGRATVFVDGGVRSGLDVLKMLALGADGVLVGRAWAFALAAGGEKGALDLIEAMGRDLRAGMAMAGCRRLDEVDRSVLLEAGADGASARGQ